MAFRVSIVTLLFPALVVFMSFSALAEEYTIKTTWNNSIIDHLTNPVTIQILKNDAQSFKIIVTAPFFNDPKGPPSGPTPPGESLFFLWDYELVKVFFLNDKREYIEIELGAWGHHFLVLLNGYRQTIRYGMPIDYSADRKNNTWQGTAIIPLDYLPPTVNKMNILSFHGTGNQRKIEALYPELGAAEFDDHKFENFQPFDWRILRSEDPGTLSLTWNDAIHDIRSFKIGHTWDGKPLSSDEDSVDLSIKLDDTKTSLIFSVNAPFYNDPAPDKSGGGSFPMLFTHEVVHLYLLSYPSLRYTEIQLGPWGHYLVAFWNGYYNHVGTYDSPITYTSNRNATHWNGSAKFPLGYLPPQVHLVNAFAGHGNGTQRRSNSLYPIPPEELGNRTMPDFHLLKFYKFIDFSKLYPDNDSNICSKIWEGMIKDCSKTSAGSPVLAGNTILVLFIVVFTLFGLF